MSTKPAREKRLFVIPLIALADHGEASEYMVKLFSIMLAPESPETQKKFFQNFQRDIVKRTQDLRDIVKRMQELGIMEGDADFWKEHGQEIYDLGQGGEYGSFDKDPFSGHKGISGSPALKGNLCGQVLYHLVENDEVSTLEDAYRVVIKHFSSNNTERVYRDEIISTPTAPYLRSVWKDFFSVAHLWLAEIAASRQIKMSLTQAIFDGVFTSEIFEYFLKVANRYRKRLVEFPLQTAHGKTLVPHPKDVWHIVKAKAKT